MPPRHQLELFPAMRVISSLFSGEIVADFTWSDRSRMQKHETAPSRSSKLPQGTLSYLFEDRTLDERETAAGIHGQIFIKLGGVEWFLI